jgi:hypothetical protein
MRQAERRLAQGNRACLAATERDADLRIQSARARALAALDRGETEAATAETSLILWLRDQRREALREEAARRGVVLS